MPFTHTLSRLAALSFALSLVLAPVSAYANSNRPIQISIEAQPLESALVAFSQQTQRQVSVDTDAVVGLQSPAVNGDMTAKAALIQLLQGSSLELVELDNSDFVIRAAAGQALLQRVTSDENSEVEVIVVTGQQIDRTLKNTKESVAVITAALVRERTLISIGDAALQTPNISGFGDDGTNVTIRGIRGGIGSGAAVGGAGDVSVIMYDNVPFVGQARSYVPSNFWDIEQVEYLRGPQSTNVGRSAMAGAVIVRSMEPDLNGFDAAVRTELSNFNTYTAEGMVNIPLSEDAAFRLTAERSETDGFISNPTFGDQGGPDTLSVRGRLLLEASDNLRILATVQYMEDESGVSEYTVPAGGDIESFEASNNDPNIFNYDGVFSSLDLSYQLSEKWSVESITSYIDGQYDRLTDSDRTALPLGTFAQTADESSFTQEIRFSYNQGSLRGATGVFYFDFESDGSTANSILTAPAAAGVPDILLPFYPEVLIAELFGGTQSSVTNSAFYTQWEWDMTDKLTLSGGFRYDVEEITQTISASGGVDPNTPLPDPVQAGQIAEQVQPGSGPVVEAGITQVNAVLNSFIPAATTDSIATDFNAFLPELGITYAVSPETNLSAFYKRGYRAGGAELLNDGTLNAYEPEYLDNFELSMRSALLDEALILNANLYYGDWKDQQLSIPIDGNPLNLGTVNVGESRIWGFEIDTDYSVSDNTSLFAGLGYAFTEFKKACRIGSTFADLPDCNIDGAAGKDLAGNRFPFAPEWTASVGARHAFSDYWFVQANATYQGGIFSDVENDPSVESDGYALLNASLGYEGERFSVILYARNLTDTFETSDKVALQNPPGTLRIFPIAPRRYGVIFSAKY